MAAANSSPHRVKGGAQVDAGLRGRGGEMGEDVCTKLKPKSEPCLYCVWSYVKTWTLDNVTERPAEPSVAAHTSALARFLSAPCSAALRVDVHSFWKSSSETISPPVSPDCKRKDKLVKYCKLLTVYDM